MDHGGPGEDEEEKNQQHDNETAGRASKQTSPAHTPARMTVQCSPDGHQQERNDLNVWITLCAAGNGARCKLPLGRGDSDIYVPH